MKISTFQYTGSGSPKSISGIPFLPEMVLIKAANSNYACFATKDMPVDLTQYVARAVAGFANGITSLNPDGFSIGTAGEVNQNGIVYHGIAISSDNLNDFATYSYTGNGSSPRNITTLQFKPTFMYIKPSNTSSAIDIRDGADTGTSAHNILAGFGNPTLALQAFINNGFTIHSDVNSNGITYYGFAFKDVPGVAKSSNYTGNGNDNRSISGIGFRPGFIIIKNNTNPTGASNRGRLFTFVGDSSTNFANLAITDSALLDAIQAFEADGWQVGTNVGANANGNDYHYGVLSAENNPNAALPLLGVQ